MDDGKDRTMAKVRETDIVQEAEAELNEERTQHAKDMVKARLREIREIKRAIKEAEKQFEELLNMELDDVADLDDF